MRYTIEEIEKVTAEVHNIVTNLNDLGSRRRMYAMTEVYVNMLATDCTTIDKEILDPAVQKLIDYFLGLEDCELPLRFVSSTGDVK